MNVELPVLVPGRQVPSPTPEEEARRIATLRAAVEHYLPECVAVLNRVVEENKKRPNNQQRILSFHQDAFASEYHLDEYTLFGMFMKYAGLYGLQIVLTGRNQETFAKNRN